MASAGSATGRGLSLEKLIIIAHVFLLLSCVAAALVQARVESVADASLSELSTAILLEAISWGAYPIISFVLLMVYKMTAYKATLLWLTLGAALIAEFPHDLAFSGVWVDMTQQNPMWALAVCVVIALVWDLSEKQEAGPVRVLVRALILIVSVVWVLVFNIGLKLTFVYLGLVIIAFFLLFMTLWGRENTMMLTAGMLGAAFIVTPAIGVIFLHYRAPLILERGRVPNALCLSFYPTMLFIAAIVGLLL